MSATSEREAVEDVSWWYQEKGQRRGPVSTAELRRLGLAPETMVWQEAFGEEWKKYDQTESYVKPIGPPPIIDTNYNPKWETTFKKFDENGLSHLSLSVWGFIFGVFYYFYLRMWWKGFVILGLSIWVGTILTLLESMGLPDTSRFLGPATNVVCMVLVKRDYYLWKRRGEKVWANFQWLKNPWALAAFIFLPLMIVVGVAAYEERDTSNRNASLAPTGPSANILPISALASPTVRDDGSVASQIARQHQAEKFCAQWLEQRYGGSAVNKYAQDTTYTYKVELHGGDIYTHSMYFGGHPMMHFTAQLLKYRNGELADTADLPEEVCVMERNLQVIGVELRAEDGLK